MQNLLPFETTKHSIDLRAQITRRDQGFLLEFNLIDPGGVVIDSLRQGASTAWPRANELWKTTCFEAFFAVPGQPGYWELNLSPSRHEWNMYAFDSARQPQPPHATNDFSLESVEVTGTKLVASVRSSKPLPAKLEANLCAVLRVDKGSLHYAVHHAANKADFHDRPSFVIKF